MSDTNRYFSRFHVLPESSQNSVTFRSVTSEPVIFDHKNVEKELARIFLVSLVPDLRSHAPQIFPRSTVSHASAGDGKYTSKTKFVVDSNDVWACSPEWTKIEIKWTK